MRDVKVYDRFSKFINIIDGPLELFLFRKWRKKFLSNLKGKVLEVGVGTGRNLPYYGKVELTAVDVSKGMLEKAEKRSNNDVSFLQMGAEDLKFKDNTFDYVVSFLVLCSVEDQVKALKEMSRVCKGKIILVEHVDSKRIFWRILLRVLKNPLKVIAGCNTTRNTVESIKDASLKIVEEKDLAWGDVFKLVVCERN
jgi:ubiquinone/menaquinone biosynthesis C-methylase UbiE